MGIEAREEIVLDGAKLRSLRLRRHLSRAEVAEGTGLSSTAIAYLEEGKHNAQPRTIRKLIRFFQCDSLEICDIVERAS